MAEMRLKYRILCALLLTCVSVQGRLSTLKRGKYEFLEPFCAGTDIYVAIPWDCTGYVHCSNLGSTTDAYWQKCPQNLYYSVEAQTCMWPKDMRKPCPPLKDIIETYCMDHRTMRFQNPDHCAQYYDCSDNSFTPGLGPHLKECPFPQVYNPNINMCAEMSTVDCMDRFTPLNKCHYVQNTGTDCTAITTPGCDGQPDGPNPYPNRILTPEYLICQRNDTVSTQVCPAGAVFDPIKLQCTINVDKLSIEIYCATHLGGTMANPANCGQYIDCNVLANHIQLGRHMGECPYPQLYSTQTSRCEMYEQVQCNTRFIPKQPCDYSTTRGSGSMQNCMATYASCIGLPDGANAIPGGGVANKYIMCRTERTVEEQTCPGGNSFDPMLKICTQTPEQGLVARQCTDNPRAILPDPDNCARYFNCSDMAVNLDLVKYQAECDYPMLFNTQTMSCDDFTVVTCGTRLEPKAPCDYLSTTTKCEGPLCSLPCLERSPSCVGMMDGNNTYPTRELSPFYMTCLGERTVSVGICRFGVYDPTPRTCTTELDPGSIQNFCSKNTAGIIPHYTNCARYYNCSAAAIMSGGKSYLQECLYPQLFNLDTMGCEPYQSVQCTFRFEPKGPCEYLQNQVCPPSSPNCLSCAQRIPSCAGLVNGNNSFSGRDTFYMVCQDERTLFVRECVGGTFDPATRACRDKPAGPVFDPNRPSTFCTAYPTEKVPSDMSCAQYYDCSSHITLLGNYKMECPYTQLFDANSGQCLPYNLVNCGLRMVPVDPCEYEANLRCPDVGICKPCRDRFVSCKGVTNGNFSIANRPTEYRTCLDQRTLNVGLCANGRFDEASSSCIVIFDQRNPSPYCALHPNALMANPDNCAQFFDCRQKSTMFGNHLRECPYLQLYSVADKSCLPFQSVGCLGRPEPKAPCEYLQNQQCYDPAGCPPCEQTKPSCIGLMDGNNTFPGRAKEHIVCSLERTVAMEKCQFDYDIPRRECGRDMSNPNIFCELQPLDVLVHPTRCAQYYDCRLPLSEYGERYMQECPYPALFDVQTGTCQDFTNVNCAQRVVPVAPCDYQYNSCVGKGPACVPCTERFVSCIGKPDGNNSYPDAEMTQRYVTCQSGRTVGLGYCSSGFFDPIRRFCATKLDAVSIQSYCQQNPSVILANPLNCAQYFDCSPRSVSEGTFLRECPYPMLFSKKTNVCVNFTDVVCEQRMEPVEPCQYLQNICDTRQPGCVPCQEKHPSCVNRLDGLNMYPGREMAPDYIVCQAGRTISTEKCLEGVFFPNRRECGLVLDEQMATQYCRANPTAIMEHQTNCAQYYDCRTAVGGSFLRECRYPQLFDQAQQVCKNFSDVRCGIRFEPQAPCEYLQTQCLQNAVNCTPCPERLPSCIGLLDGSNPFPTRPNSQYYVKCFQNRTVAVEVCQVSLFEPTTKSCSDIIDPTVLAGFCQENPAVLIPDPQHCARFYNCSDPSIQQGLGVPHLHECKYPRLFGYGATNCQLFTEIDCATRYEAKAPCEYVENQCFNATCQPCQENYPSCVGKQDGSNNFPGREGTEYYIVCYKDRTVAIVTCTTGFYNHATRSCEYVQNQQCNDPAGCPPCEQTNPSCIGLIDGNYTFPGRPKEHIVCSMDRTVAMVKCHFDYDIERGECGWNMSNPNMFCDLHPLDVLVHPTQCAQYYDCRLPISEFGERYLQECPYPALFDVQTGTCQDFSNVACAQRVVPIAPCDYQYNSCVGKGPTCVPCTERFVSCIGKPDGNNSYPDAEMTQRYITCRSGRTVGLGYCSSGYFDPIRRFCATTLDAVSIQSYCQQTPSVFLANPLNCAQYLDCSPQSVSDGSFLRECPYPMLFSKNTNDCVNFTDVVCEQRMEPVEPCQYLQNNCDTRQPGCVPCQENHPSCVNLLDGFNMYPGREMAPEYIVCQAGRTISKEKCREGVFFPNRRECGLILDDQTATQYCSANPTAIMEHHTNCAQYYDCRTAVGGSFLRECRYPQLFDQAQNVCKNFSDVRCGIRFEPQAPCEYLQTQCLQNAANCTPCPERLPSCIGLLDGSNPFPTRPNSPYYVKCFQNRTVGVEVCQVSLFDPMAKSCSDIIDSTVLAGFCQENPSVLIPDPQHCARFYNCSDPSIQQGLGVPHLHECKYPRLFGYRATNCQLFTEINCATRYEAKAPCEYVENQCFNTTCQPCQQNFPSCVGKQDGSNNFSGREGTEYYIVCYKDRTVAIVTCTTGEYVQNQQCYDPAGCPPCEQTNPSCIGLIDGNYTFPGRPKEHIVCSMERTVAMVKCHFDYDIERGECRWNMSNPNMFCDLHPLDVLVHPTRCAQYYDCRLPNSEFGERYMQECPYPALFDVQTGTCQDFSNVACAQRVVPIAPCDYQHNSCVGKGPACVPCTERFVSCIGKPDGNNSYPGAEMTQRYITCQSGRTVGLGYCSSGFFDPIRRFCATTLDAVSIQSYCQQTPSVFLANPLNCAQYLDCSPRSVSDGSFLRECPYPMLFSKNTNDCVNFTDVACEQRMEPVEPCQYLQNNCDIRQPGCVPCQEKHPSCLNLPDGFNMYPGREMAPDYIKCQAGRTIYKETCRVGVFFPNRRECGLILDDQTATQYCSANPTAIMEHHTNCAQYYDCRKAVGGSFLRECRYPQLFDQAQHVCKNFSDVRCGIRFEPQAPCEYLQTQCLQSAVNCTPCIERLPSCIGLLDGSNPFPTRPNSPYYVKCFQNRTVGVEVCQVSLFDPMTKSCSDIVDPTVLAGFCQENPAVLIPDPQHCARFYNCSDPSIQQGLGVPHLHECKYPRLFGYRATNCQLFTEINCATRYEAKAPCEYVENQCFNTTCQPCHENFPSCVGKQDGSNNFSGREGTEYYIVCYKDRTVAIVTCTTGSYNHATKSCEGQTGIRTGPKSVP